VSAAGRSGLRGRALLLTYDAVGLLAAATYASAAAVGRVAGGDGLSRLRERVGRYDGGLAPRGTEAGVWLHAASVGEVRAAEPLIAALRKRVPQARFVMTCQTSTGLALAARLAVDEVRYFPIDCRFVVRRALARFRPSLFLFVEAEIWPRLLLELAAAGVPAAMLAARVSEVSFRRYRRVRALFSPALATLALVCARDGESLRRLLALGVPSPRGRVVGDVKLDALDAGDVTATADALAGREVGAEVVFALSTHEGEEEIILDAFSRVRRTHSSALLVLAPRHPQRAEKVAALAGRYGRVARWSRDRCARGWDVLVVDTTGDARMFFPAASCAFVGGSLVDVGGHNLVEPAVFGVPCAVGPRLENVKHQANLLHAAGALVVVENAEGLAHVWSRWLDDSAASQRVGRAARAAVDANRGAVARTMNALEPWIEALSAGASV
jgi:3-deoxy-D-manno-octulosonic-acid transferase